MSSTPPGTCSKNGVARSYIAWLATESGVHRWAGCMGSTITSPGRTVPSTDSLPMKGSAQNEAHSSTLPA